jgi:hypothetical protein
MERLDNYQETGKRSAKAAACPGRGFFATGVVIVPLGHIRLAPCDVSISKYNSKLRFRHAAGQGTRLWPAGD